MKVLRWSCWALSTAARVLRWLEVPLHVTVEVLVPEFKPRVHVGGLKIVTKAEHEASRN